MLSGDPASGKSVMISVARNLLRDLASQPQGVFLGPDNPTKASFLHSFEKSTKLGQHGLGLYSAMYVLCLELGVFISKYEKDFVADLTSIYDNLDIYTAPRTSTHSVSIESPTLNILAGATPDALGDTIPETGWGQGFTSRVIFIYGPALTTYRDPFKRPQQADFARLSSYLKEYFHEIYGEFIWEDDAQDADRHWLNELKMEPVPTYGRLKHYNTRRNEHLVKLAMVSAISAGHGLTVTLSDFERAQTWLFEAESKMPDIFRAMHQKSDQQLLNDTHYWLYTEWSNPNLPQQKPISERKICVFLENKLPGDKIEGFIKLMERTGRMRKAGLSGEWIPNTIDQFTDL